jgi:hypothetical protein
MAWVYRQIVTPAGEKDHAGACAAEVVGSSGCGAVEGNGGAVGRPLSVQIRSVPLGGNTMASIRTARVLAAVAALPLAAVLFAGTAAADDGALAGDRSNAAVVTNSGGNVGGGNLGNVTTTQQAATGAGASNENSTASVTGSAFTAIDQGHVGIYFSPLW